MAAKSSPQLSQNVLSPALLPQLVQWTSKGRLAKAAISLLTPLIRPKEAICSLVPSTVYLYFFDWLWLHSVSVTPLRLTSSSNTA